MVAAGMNGHRSKSSHPAPESRVGEEGTSKRNITRKGGVKVGGAVCCGVTCRVLLEHRKE